MNVALPEGYKSWIEFYNSFKDKIKEYPGTEVIKFSNWTPEGMNQFEFTVDFIKARCFEEAEAFAHYEIYHTSDYSDPYEERMSNLAKLQYISGFRIPNEGTVRYFEEYRKSNNL